MSAGPSDRERISALEEHSRLHEVEIERNREKLHKHAGSIQANSNDLEVFKARLIGWAAGFGFASGLAATLLLKLIER